MEKYINKVRIHSLVYKRWGFILETQFHVIGGDGYYYHLKWDNNNKKFKKLHDLGTYGTDIIIKDVIKVSKNKIWIIGYDKEYNFIIKEYLNNNNRDSWKNKISLTQDPLHSKINELDTRLCCISVYNESLLIIFGNEHRDNAIHIVDIYKRTFRLSTIKLPSICSNMHASSSRNAREDEILVYGYCKQIEINIPHYLKETISCWMVTEYIQVFCGQGNILWGINVDDICEFENETVSTGYDVPSGFLNRKKRKRNK